ncbi:hypothetical protein BHE74_00044590, partial [Ensete ventricosum]
RRKSTIDDGSRRLVLLLPPGSGRSVYRSTVGPRIGQLPDRYVLGGTGLIAQ